MNIDQGYNSLSNLKQSKDSSLILDNLPSDYFYSTEYNYMTLPEVQLLLTLLDSNISYSFSGLRKTTELHQYQLTKALKRLQDRNFISKNDRGTYELTYAGSRYTTYLIKNLMNSKAINIDDIEYKSQWKRIKTIPPLEQEIIKSLFEKRWFDNFRFMYRKVLKSHILLCWEDSNKNQVHLLIHKDGTIDIEYRETEPSNSNIGSVTNWFRNELLDFDDVSIEVYDDEIDNSLDDITYN